MLHFHRLDHGKSLPEDHAIADASKKFQHTPMHGRLDHVVPAPGGDGTRRKILNADAGLAAATQYVSLRARPEQVHVSSRFDAVNRKSRTVVPIGDDRLRVLAVD